MSGPRPAHAALFDRQSLRLAEGSFAGVFADVSVPTELASALTQWRRRRAWTYVVVHGRGVTVVLGIVDVGFATSLIAFVSDEERGTFVDRSGKGLGGLTMGGATRITARFSGAATDTGSLAHAGTAHARYQEDLARRRAELSLDDARITARLELDLAGASTLSAATAFERRPSVGLARFARTEKSGAALVRGSVLVDGHRVVLDGAVATVDVSDAFPLADTRWRWISILGDTDQPAPFAVNLCEGYLGAAECVMFERSGLTPLGPISITPFRGERRAPDEVRATGAEVDVLLRPLPFAATHYENMRGGPVASDLEQHVMRADGSVRGRVLRDARAIVERHDARW